SPKWLRIGANAQDYPQGKSGGQAASLSSARPGGLLAMLGAASAAASAQKAGGGGGGGGLPDTSWLKSLLPVVASAVVIVIGAAVRPPATARFYFPPPSRGARVRAMELLAGADVDSAACAKLSGAASPAVAPDLAAAPAVADEPKKPRAHKMPAEQVQEWHQLFERESASVGELQTAQTNRVGWEAPNRDQLTRCLKLWKAKSMPALADDVPEREVLELSGDASPSAQALEMAGADVDCAVCAELSGAASPMLVIELQAMDVNNVASSAACAGDAQEALVVGAPAGALVVPDLAAAPAVADEPKKPRAHKMPAEQVQEWHKLFERESASSRGA
ncbi:hypothetical protein T492DRAFT_896303, partial [Pavlovales sp. CCMP2436]